MAYFDNASTTFPKPESVYRQMDTFYRASGASMGRGIHSFAKNTNMLVNDTRKALQDLLHCPTKQVIFTPTATIALNMIIQGLIADGAKTIYISPFEHNAVTRVLYHFEKAGIVHVRILSITKDLSYDFEQIRYQFDKEHPDLVIISHASNVIGLIAPIIEIFDLAKHYLATTVADMSQTAGLIDIDVGSEFIDFAVFAGHKTLYGPTGISGFVMKKTVRLAPILFGGTGFDSANQDMPEALPQMYEPGTINTIGIAGLNAALNWIQDTTISQILSVEKEHRQKLIGILHDYSWIKPVGVRKENDYIGIISCIIDGISSDVAGQLFTERGIAVRTGLQCAPSAHKVLGTYPAGTIRLSVSYFNTEGDYDQLREALDDIEDNM